MLEEYCSISMFRASFFLELKVIELLLKFLLFYIFRLFQSSVYEMNLDKNGKSENNTAEGQYSNFPQSN